MTGGGLLPHKYDYPPSVQRYDKLYKDVNLLPVAVVALKKMGV